MPALYRLLKLAWRYRRFIALALTVSAGIFERNREHIPGPLQKLDPARIPGVRARGSDPEPTKT